MVLYVNIRTIMMPVNVDLINYIDRLRESEAKKPLSERRYIPTYTDMAKVAGVTRQGFSGVINNHTVAINRSVIYGAIKSLRECGFDTDFNDVLIYTDD